MSVINKMLRDLDQRQAKTLSEATLAARPPGPSAVPSFGEPRNGVSHGFAQTGSRQHLHLLWLGGALLAAAAAGWWWQNRVVASDAPQVEPRAMVPAAEVAPVVVASAAPALALMKPVISAAVVRTEPKPQPKLEVKVEITTKAAMPPVMARVASQSAAPTDLRAAAPERASNPKPDAPTGVGAADALERAQALWNMGSRDAALDLLQGAVAVVERQGAGGSFLQGNPALLPLVRELTRMQLADSRHGAVWDLLTRLEPQLGSAPDLWAIRANAAQRLGRHQDSVHAYLAALQSRPNEQRWLLGAAVSLAALGQISAAAEMADKARTAGVVSPEVLAYLNQMGVPLRDK